MRRFADLYDALDASTGTSDKVAALVRYFGEAPPEDAAWAVYFLAGGKPRQVLPTALLREAACRRAGIDDWLFEECYQAVGDLAETIAHILPAGQHLSNAGLAEWVEQRVLALRGLAPAEQTARIVAAWDELDAGGRFLLLKLIGGGFRVGVSKLLVQRALALHAGLDAKLVAQRLVGWTDARATPSAARLQALLAPPSAAAGGVAEGDDLLGVDGSARGSEDSGQPYPFFLAHALQTDPKTFAATLGEPADWLVEWKYDGIRAQVVKRAGVVWVWSRGEELVSDRFPEVVASAAAWPDGTVVDGELLVWPGDAVAPASFNVLQQRIGRKAVNKKVLADAPVSLLAYDLLEEGGLDLRNQTLTARRERLEAFAQAHCVRLSPRVQATDWQALAALRLQSRQRGVEGFMLKQGQSRYGSGRTKADGTWWKWKVDP
ncbi:MAG TPA: cisplatin damage response ATP-dependent DNA ligase, partial [Rubrivivax sp.]|nr:cisplatin damage response ATP-dependent DNA ligase [Rubrivivax sp.]